MNKAEAKRAACGIVASQIDASCGDFVEQAGYPAEGADADRLYEALNDLSKELRARSIGRVNALTV